MQLTICSEQFLIRRWNLEQTVCDITVSQLLEPLYNNTFFMGHRGHHASFACLLSFSLSLWVLLGWGIISKWCWRCRNGNRSEIKLVSKKRTFSRVNGSCFDETLFTKKSLDHTYSHFITTRKYNQSHKADISCYLYHYPAITQTYRFCCLAYTKVGGWILQSVIWS